jgi:putative hydrolase of the HAD superfamily
MHRFCVVFDLDDTLFLERDYVISGFEAVGAWAAEWLAIPSFTSECIHRFDRGQRHDIFDTVLGEHLGTVPPELVSSLVEIYRTHFPKIKMEPDVADALAEMPSDWPVAVLTDGPVTSQTRKCDVLGLRPRTAVIVLTGALGAPFWKPSKAGFEYISQRVSADGFVYVGDNPAKDFLAPRQLGWISVRVRRPRGLHYAVENAEIAPDLEMGDCFGLAEALAHL